ncbi:hypothetical protein CFC21_081534 [Triticum aestivum]|uniref:Uncharacterized protein n=5 Tax=Triticum TaxID=4564 RepID=A0A9R1AV78_TRITD|nr:uncharacterized protein LOC123131647 isoform X1 [Triticum aestivum]KAF7076935.1 hypothetical protein CFC21_081534 [Triticum aestivum]VAI41425.1 unnamed protein product [Triticum turgidum subsp. durum]
MGLYSLTQPGPSRLDRTPRDANPHHYPLRLAAGAAMLRLRRSVLSKLLSYPSVSPLHRLISTTAPAPAVAPSTGFAVEEYLVSTCGLTRPQALKASAKLSHLKFPSNPDAVLAFLAGLGLSGADAAALVAKDPKFLCADVGRTLSPVAAGLAGLGLSPSEITRLASLAPDKFRSRSIVSKLHYYLPLVGSYENLLGVLRYGSCLVSSDLETVVKPNVAFLRESGLADCDIAKLCVTLPCLLTSGWERIQALVLCAEGLGIPRRSGMFRHALHAVAFVGEQKVAAKLDCLKRTFGWSDAEVGIAVSKYPMLLTKSHHMLQSKSEFLISEVGLEPAFIANRPVIVCLSLEGRLRPRYYVLKFLKENGLLKGDPSYYTVVMVNENVFAQRYMCPYKEAAPYLAEDYATACGGEVPARFVFA